jgi:RHS repeat-associated protein
VSYAYNGNGQMSSLTDWAGGTISFGYDPDGNLTSVGYPNDTALSATYDLGDAETAVSAFTGTPSDPGTSLLGVSYSLNSAEQVSSETDTGAISSSVSYTYSPADRLGSVKVGSGSPASTAYNASGDPTTLADATTQSFNTDDQLTSATSASEATESYTYNATGDRTASSGTISGSATYGFGENDELATASVGSASVSYMYNGDGLLAGRTTLTATATDTWDTATGLPLLLSDGTNDYLYGPGGTVLEQASLASGTPEYYLSDGQGSTRALLGTSGSVAATFSFDTYGNLTSSTGSATTPLLYDGQYKDAATGLYYLRARWYDPGTGQFISVDPDVAETAQPYTYAADDSVNESDPTGLMLEYGGVGALSYLACSVASSGSETDFSTARRSECLFTQFLEKGYSQYAAAAVVGNIYAESAGTDAGDGGPLPATESNPMLAAQAAGTGCGLSISLPTSENANQAAANCENVGIAQWGQGAGSSNNSRVAGLVDYARQQGQPWWNFLTQVGYIFHELTSNTPVTQYTGTDVANTLKTCGSSLYNCTSDFMVEYEGPKGNSAVLRTTYAQLALNAWQGIASDGLTCDLWAGWQHAAIIAGGVI